MIDTSTAEVQQLKEKLLSAEKILVWARLSLSVVGLNPVNDNNILYGLVMLYSLGYTIMCFLYIWISSKDRTLPLDAPMELLIFVGWLLKLIIFKQKSPILFRLLANLSADFSISRFTSTREINILIDYIALAKKFIKYSFITTTASCIFYGWRDFIINGFHIPTKTDSENVTTYLLPYRIKFYCPLTNLTSYSLACLYCLPAMVIGMFYCVSDVNVLATLVAHACGQLAILSRCYFELLGDYPNEFKLRITEAIRKNDGIMNFVQDINSAFSLTMLLQRLSSVFILCYFLYSTISIWDESATIALLFNISTVFGELVLIFAYSYIGQCLIDESSYLNDALCKSSWYNLKPQDLRCYLILLAHTRTPLYINCGNFYVCSLESFVTIIKSAMAYVSVLSKITNKSEI